MIRVALIKPSFLRCPIMPPNRCQFKGSHRPVLATVRTAPLWAPGYCRAFTSRTLPQLRRLCFGLRDLTRYFRRLYWLRSRRLDNHFLALFSSVPFTRSTLPTRTLYRLLYALCDPGPPAYVTLPRLHHYFSHKYSVLSAFSTQC